MRHNPEDDPTIDQDSFTFALKYGSTSNNQNYYICPKVWCPYCQKPILFSKVKNIRKRMTVEGECTIGTCPNGDHEVFIMTKKYYPDKKFDKSGLYPGFVRQLNPDGLCLPCCFSKPHNIPGSAWYNEFKKCLREEIIGKKDEENVRYILGSGQFVPEGRFALLPPTIAKFFGKECKQGNIDESCFFRKGVEYRENQGFLSCIADIISDDRQHDVDELKDYLIEKLTPKLFRTLNGGSLEILFDPKLSQNKNKNKNKNKNNKSALNNFKEFILSKERIDEKYLWDYLSRPGILYPEGVNIIIFTEETLICPLGFNVKEFYDLSRITVFMIKYSKHYTPIYYIKYDEGDISIQKFFSTVLPIVLNILMILRNNCLETSSINWKRILKDNEKKYKIEYDIDLEKEISLKQTIKILNSFKTYKIKSQIIDYYNKCIALLLNDNIYLPILPSNILLDYDIILMDDLTLLSYTTLKKNLEEIQKKTKINCKPTYKILSENNKNIIAMILNTGRIVPVKISPLVKDNLPIKDIPYYSNANKVIHDTSHESNKRMETVNRMEYENESYNRLRFELSKYLKKHDKIMKDIKSVIKSDVKIEMKRKSIYKILIFIFKQLVSTKNRNIDFATYRTPNLRTICFENKDC